MDGPHWVQGSSPPKPAEVETPSIDDFWFCFAIDEGIVYANIELPIIGDGPPFVVNAEHYPPGTGTPLPGTVMTPSN